MTPGKSEKETTTYHPGVKSIRRSRMGLKTSKLLPKHIEQLSKQTGFDHDEIDKWHRGFVRDCPTGKLQKSEFVPIYRELFPNGNATTFSEFIFNVFDAGKLWTPKLQTPLTFTLDESGTIEFEEFLYAMAITSKSSLEQKVPL